MKRFVPLVVIAICLPGYRAAAVEGDNLLIDGSFDADQAGFPEFWTASSVKDVVYDPAGGPEGAKPSVGLRGDETTSGTVSVRQYDLTLVPGETYKISAYVRTKGFKNGSAGLIVHNTGWVSANGLQSFPADSDWTFMEKTFTLFPSKDNQYGVAMYAVRPRGEIHFADVKLQAMSEEARQGSSSGWSKIAKPRLVPLTPLLSRIPHDAPELTLRFFGYPADRREAYECVVGIDDNPIPQQTIPVGDGTIPVPLAGLACGEYTLQAMVRHRETRESILDAAYSIRIVEVPAIDLSNVRPLNNLVSEVLNQPVAGTSAPQMFTFVNPRDGWIFVALTTDAPPPDLAIRLNGEDPLITAATDRLEAFRELPMGEHRVTIAGNTAEARLVVRSIPEIFNYPPCVDSFVKENGSYDWDFMKEHILYAVTTLNGGRLPGDALPEAKALGLKWLANFNVDPVDDPGDVQERMEQHSGMTQPQYDGLTSDELFFSRATIANYTEALWRLRNPENRLVYTWIVGKPSLSSVHTDFLSACVNVSGGRGRLLFEAYCHPQPDEVAAAAYLDDKIGETIRLFNAYLPNASAGTGIIFGNFNQIPIISLEHDPAVDFKYYLDMQVNLIANSPDFKGLATTGYWGTYYADEELVRWSFKLMRHYAVEGNKDMLSTRYGLKYNPGFLTNGDFADGTTGWSVSPAAEDSVRTATINGYGKNCQGRWGAGAAGDTVCVMTRHADKPNRISQTAEGLEVGRTYCLQFVTADYNDVVQQKHNPRRYGIDMELAGAEMLPERSFVHVDRRSTHRRRDAGHLGKINLHGVIFRARSAVQQVVFSDEKATPGEELMINFVQLKPYLE
ncbi:MAG: hypothetical protein RBS80_09195 [Thermoguttaceae bacterium]|jgi:hypothetical protein|nr:hypothetical protein [Thermoguttaceae bacterium]